MLGNIQKPLYGSLLGGAVGDVYGLPFEGSMGFLNCVIAWISAIITALLIPNQMPHFFLFGIEIGLIKLIYPDE